MKNEFFSQILPKDFAYIFQVIVLDVLELQERLFLRASPMATSVFWNRNYVYFLDDN